MNTNTSVEMKSIPFESNDLMGCIESAYGWFSLIDSHEARMACEMLSVIKKKASALEFQVKTVKRNYQKQKKKAETYKAQIKNTIRNREKQ